MLQLICRMIAKSRSAKKKAAMQRILIISSHVAYDSVGIAPTNAPLQGAGIEVTALPTIVLSNHPGHARFAGITIDAEALARMTDALDANGWLGKFDAVLSGYLPSAAHVSWMRDVVERVRRLNRDIRYFCDPVLGDDPKGIYVPREAAEAVRDLLVPISDILTPNRFELAWLAGKEIRSVADAIGAARDLGRPRLVATSVPAGAGLIANVLVAGQEAYAVTVPTIEKAPHGTGDLFAGLLAAELIQGAPDDAALGYAAGGVRHALEVSRDSDRLLLAAIEWGNDIAPAVVERVR